MKVDTSQQFVKEIAGKTLSVDMANRTIEHYVSTPAVDEDGDVLLPRGADISRFRKTGTVFDVHQYGSKDVVGRNRSFVMQDDGIIAKTRMTPRPPPELFPANEVWWPDTLLWLYQQGDIKGWSVGFTILEARFPTKLDREKYGPECKRVISKWRVMEYSVAPLPANGEALTLSFKGVISPRLADCLKSGRMPREREWDAGDAGSAGAMLAPAESPVIQPTKAMIFEIPGETPPAPARMPVKKMVFFIPPEETKANEIPARSSADEYRLIAEIEIRKARGEMLV